jgi:hypothetical protein
MFYLSLSAFDIAHALFDLSPVAGWRSCIVLKSVYMSRTVSSVSISVSTSSGAMLNGSVAKV